MPTTEAGHTTKNTLGEKRASALRGSDAEASGAAELSAAGAKKKRQARQASIIIEELERALVESSFKGSGTTRRIPLREEDDESEDDESDIGSYGGGDLSD